MRHHLTQWASGPTVGSDQSQSSAILKLYVLDESYQISLCLRLLIGTMGILILHSESWGGLSEELSRAHLALPGPWRDKEAVTGPSSHWSLPTEENPLQSWPCSFTIKLQPRVVMLKVTRPSFSFLPHNLLGVPKLVCIIFLNLPGEVEMELSSWTLWWHFQDPQRKPARARPVLLYICRKWIPGLGELPSAPKASNLFSVVVLFVLNWCIIALQCCVSFCCTITVTLPYVCIYPLPLGLTSHSTPRPTPLLSSVAIFHSINWKMWEYTFSVFSVAKKAIWPCYGQSAVTSSLPGVPGKFMCVPDKESDNWRQLSLFFLLWMWGSGNLLAPMRVEELQCLFWHHWTDELKPESFCFQASYIRKCNQTY